MLDGSGTAGGDGPPAQRTDLLGDQDWIQNGLVVAVPHRSVNERDWPHTVSFSKNPPTRITEKRTAKPLMPPDQNVRMSFQRSWVFDNARGGLQSDFGRRACGITKFPSLDRPIFRMQLPDTGRRYRGFGPG